MQVQAVCDDYVLTTTCHDYDELPSTNAHGGEMGGCGKVGGGALGGDSVFALLFAI